MAPKPVCKYLADGTLLEEHPSLPSTNDHIRQLIKEGHKMPDTFIVWAREQTQGRGRGQNQWLSKKNKNLSLSYYMHRPGMEAERQFDLARAACLAIIQLLSTHGIVATAKWPNDIYVRDNKIAGLLIENSISGRELRNTIIGIGLNVNQTSFPISHATSICKETGIESPVDRLVPELHSLFSLYLAMAREHAGELHGLFDEKLMHNGHIIHYISNGNEKSAKLLGTDSYGQIVLEKPGHKPMVYGMDDIKLKIR